MDQPKVSIILPVRKAGNLLSDTLDSLLAQTYGYFEVLCVNCGDSSSGIAEKYQKKDQRVHPVAERMSSIGAAANRGLELVAGEYVMVLSEGDIAARNLLEKCTALAREQSAQVVGFNGHYISRENPGKKIPFDIPDPALLRNLNAVYSPADYPDCCLSLLRGGVRFRMIHSSLIRERKLRFGEYDTHWQQSFCAQCDLYAQRIALMEWHLLTFSPEEERGDSHAVLAAADTMLGCGDGNQAILRWVIEYTTAAFSTSLSNFTSEAARMLYTGVHQRFGSEAFSFLDRKKLPVKERAFFDAIRTTGYEEMNARCSREMVVSFTSFPGRIGTANRIVENIRRQTRKPDKVLLFLAAVQFPRREEELPEALLAQADQGLVEIKWCSDLRSHKKYFFAMQEHPDSLIVTVDDDLIYPDTMLQSLLDCYLCFPKAICAMRVHMCVLDEANKQILPYAKWIKEYRQQVYTPSPQLFATSGAGTLFPPGTLSPNTFVEEAIRQLCPYADDIWLNAMALINGTTTVLAANNFYLKYIEGTQAESLQTINVENNQNEVQFTNIRAWIRERYGCDLLYQRMEQIPSDVRCTTVSDVCDLYQILDVERKLVQKKLNQAYQDKSARGLEIKQLKETLAAQQKLLQQYENGVKKNDGVGNALKRAVKKIL